jgi:hypothetical protein
MMFGRCSHASEIAEVMKNGHWPEACEANLRDHVNACRSCSDFVLVTRAFQAPWVKDTREARLASPGLLWWRAQLLRRHDAFERIGKPIAAAQVFAWSITLLVALGFVVSEWRNGADWLSWWAGFPGTSAFRWEALWSFASGTPDWSLMLLIPSLGVLALLGGVVVYLASERQ